MTRLGLLVLGLAALLAPGLAVDPDNLNEIVNQLRNRFAPKLQDSGKVPIFSLAVRVPEGSQGGQYDVSQVTDSSEDVRNKIRDDCDVYVGSRLVAGTVLLRKGEKHCKNKDTVFGHAESRVLQKFPWQKPQGSELMLFYTSSSPCDGTCTNKGSKFNILGKIKVINAWENHVVVFSDLFQPSSGSPIRENKLIQSLENLAEIVGRDNIYRCAQGRCRRCFDNNGVVKFCISDQNLSDNSPGRRSSGGSMRRTQSEGQYGVKEQGRSRKDRTLQQDQNRTSRSQPQTGRRSRRGSQSPRGRSPVRSNSKPHSRRRSRGEETSLMILQ